LPRGWKSETRYSRDAEYISLTQSMVADSLVCTE
jgi:hypothetical protein